MDADLRLEEEERRRLVALKFRWDQQAVFWEELSFDFIYTEVAFILKLFEFFISDLLSKVWVQNVTFDFVDEVLVDVFFETLVELLYGSKRPGLVAVNAPLQ